MNDQVKICCGFLHLKHKQYVNIISLSQFSDNVYFAGSNWYYNGLVYCRNAPCHWLMVSFINVTEIVYLLPYFLGYKTDFFPSKTIPKI